MAIVYNLDIKPPNDYYFNVAENAMRGLSEVVLPGAALMNVFPGLRHLPRWVPGIGFEKAAALRKLITEMKDGTFEHALGQMVCVISLLDMRDSEFGLQKKGNNASLIARLLDENDTTGGSADDMEIIKEVSATAYAGRSMFSDCLVLKLI